MDSKKRKTEENGSGTISVEDARKIIEPFTQEQLLDILQEATARHPDVLDLVRAIADRDPTDRKLFIRGLGWDTTTESLRTLFSQYGEIEEGVVILDKATGKSKGYGFVTFKHIDGALNALKEPSKKIDGRMTVTQLAASGNQPSVPSVDVSARKIFVGNVPFDMPADRLLHHFLQYGEVEEGPLGFDKQTGKSRGFALFVYKTVEAAKAALEEPNKSVDGHQLVCKLAVDGKKGRPLAGQENPVPEPTGLGGLSGPPTNPPPYGLGHSGYTQPGMAGPSLGHHLNSPLQSSVATPGLSSLRGGVSGPMPSTLGVGGGAYGAGHHTSGLGAYGSSQAYGHGAGVGYGGSGGGSMYGLPPRSQGVGSYPEPGHYGALSSTTSYQSQHHHHPPSGASPVPRVPSGAAYPPYY
ncbi:hypothetical protein AMTRI_Chr01g132820 [Amborella trichopoda]